MTDNTPQGFILSEAALYAFRCQDVYPDILSFAAAIPNHLKPLFLIPIQISAASDHTPILAARIASRRYGDGPIPTGNTSEAELFGTKTFVNDDNEPLITDTGEGSIFEIDDGWAGRTKHQETNLDQNIQVPTDTSYMEDVDTTQYQKYPYRTEEKPVRHSSVNVPTLLVRIAIKPEELTPKAPEKIKNNAQNCNVKLVSYDKKTRIYTFSVNCGHAPHTVRASLSDIDHVSLNCDCAFWRWNGPEFHAKSNSYMIAPQHGTATPPDIRDPDRQYALCKHTYAVLRRLDSFVQEVVEENWDKDEEDLKDVMDSNWDRLEGVADIPLEDIEEEDPLTNVDWEDESSEDEDEPSDSDEDDDTELDGISDEPSSKSDVDGELSEEPVEDDEEDTDVEEDEEDEEDDSEANAEDEDGEEFNQ